MSSFEILYTSESIRTAIRDIFKKNSGRRVAVVAFVGSRAEAYLPHPKGLELYCWPAVPGTNPDAIEKLANELGVDVHFADKIHMKVYWSANGGAVIASSNLSSNAYGHGDLKELGVRLPVGAVDINKILKSFHSTRATNASLKVLKDASVQHWLRTRQNMGALSDVVTFASWYESNRRKHRWRLSAWEDSDLRESRKLREAVSTQKRISLEDYMAMRKSDEAEVNDYILCVYFDKKRIGKIEWFFVSHKVAVPRTDPGYLKDYPYQIGQEHPLKMYRRPPFQIDKRFSSAVKAAYRDIPSNLVRGAFDLENIVEPNAALLKALYTRYQKEN